MILALFQGFRWGWIALLLPALLAGCGGPGSNEMASMGSTISVMVERENELDRLNMIATQKMLNEQKREYQRYHPGGRLVFEMVNSDVLEQRLQYRASRGLLPDLLLLVGNDLMPLKNKGYISSL